MCEMKEGDVKVKVKPKAVEEDYAVHTVQESNLCHVMSN